jgi:hypothetical protein
MRKRDFFWALCLGVILFFWLHQKKPDPVIPPAPVGIEPARTSAPTAPTAQPSARVMQHSAQASKAELERKLAEKHIELIQCFSGQSLENRGGSIQLTASFAIGSKFNQLQLSPENPIAQNCLKKIFLSIAIKSQPGAEAWNYRMDFKL